jgi:hypothetical protein
MVKTTLVLKVVGSVLGAVVIAGGGIALADQTGPFSPGPKVTSTARDDQADPSAKSNEDGQEGNDTGGCVQATAEPSVTKTDTPRASATSEGSDERGDMPTASSTATPNKSEGSDDGENEQAEDCNQGGEPVETAAPRSTGSDHENGETVSTRTAAPQHTAEPTASLSHD